MRRSVPALIRAKLGRSALNIIIRLSVAPKIYSYGVYPKNAKIVSNTTPLTATVVDKIEAG